MEASGQAKNGMNPRTGSGGKGSLLDSSKQRSGFSGMESPLATQLQQAWLQTQLPKRNVPKLDFLSPLPSPDYLATRTSPDYYQPYAFQQAKSNSSSFPSHPSPSFSQYSPQPSPDSFSDTYTSQSDVGSVSGYGENEVGADSDPMEDDQMLQYLSDMLMDEEMSDQKCMYVQCSAYQVLNQELADLIGDTDPTGDLFSKTGEAPPTGEEEKDVSVNSWIDEVLKSDPREVLLEDSVGDSQSAELADEVSSIAAGITNITTGAVPDVSSAPPAKKSADADLTPAEREADALDVYCPYTGNERTSDAVDYSNGRSGIESLVELYPLLMQCAQAVASDDVRQAHNLVNELRQKSSPVGDGGQRMTYYFVEALVARLSGTGARLYTALTSSRPSAHRMLLAYRMCVQSNPLPKISHYFANASILNAVKNSEKIHIVDYGILYGVQWPCFMRKLSLRPGGPPHVRITGIDFAQPGFQKNNRVEETGRRLAEKARQFGVDFEYHAIAGKWETIQPAQLNLRNDETLVVNCMFRLRNLLDETVMASSPRKMVLAKIHSMNPKLFTMGVISAGYNSPFFMPRFRETFNHFASVFDSIHSAVPPDSELRVVAEKEVFGREILNIIACEGTERIERSETYRQWQSRSLNAGFKQQPLDPTIAATAQDFLKRYHRNYGIAQDGHWLLTGWRERVFHGLTAWTPA